MKHYRINIPGVAHPMTVTGHDEKSARKSARDRFGYGKRLPNGTKIYPIEPMRG
jgi:hypothetical protein